MPNMVIHMSTVVWFSLLIVAAFPTALAGLSSQISQQGQPAQGPPPQEPPTQGPPPQVPPTQGPTVEALDSCSGFEKHRGLATLYTDPGNEQFLLIDITDHLLGPKATQVLVTAHAARGVNMDGHQMLTLHEPLENTRNTMMEFRLAKDNNSVEVFKPQTTLRTSDGESRKALHMGAPALWTASFPRASCAKDGGQGPAKISGQKPSPQMQTSNQPPPDGDGTQPPPVDVEDDRIIIDGAALIMQGFFATPSFTEGTSQVSSFRLMTVKSFPRNFDITVEILLETMEGSMPVAITFSVLALPEQPMAIRRSDDRAGYFKVDFTDLGQHAREPEMMRSDAIDTDVTAIWRYNLDALPDKQIRVYVDPTVPLCWRPYFKQGIEAWNAAYAMIGYPNAVRAVLPGDPDWPEYYHPGDARYNTITWSIDTNGVYSEGIAKIDPRSGEILKSDIIMSHGWIRAWIGELDHISPKVGRQVKTVQRGIHRQELLLDAEHVHGKHLQQRGLPFPANSSLQSLESPVQLEPEHVVSLIEQKVVAAAKARTRGIPLSPAKQKEIMGEGLRSVVMHEVGHTLGLRHNFKGSLGVSYECTQNISCTAEQGLSASIMDYLPMNVPAAGVGGQYSNVHLFSPVIGQYDKLAIIYGYMDETNSTGSSYPSLEAVLEKAEGYQNCLDGDMGSGDPLCMQHDLSADPVRWYENTLELTKESQKQLLDTAVAPGQPYAKYGDSALQNFMVTTGIGLRLADFLGGVNISHIHKGATGSNWGRDPNQPISAAMQQRALSTLLKIMRPYSSDLMPPRKTRAFLVKRNTDGISKVDMREEVRYRQELMLEKLLDPSMFAQMEESDGFMDTEGARGLTCGDYLRQLFTGIFQYNNTALTSLQFRRYEWDLQIMFLKELKELYQQNDMPMEVLSQISFRAESAKKAVDDALQGMEPDKDKQLKASSFLAGSAALRNTAIAAELAQNAKPEDLLREHLLGLRDMLSALFKK